MKINRNNLYKFIMITPAYVYLLGFFLFILCFLIKQAFTTNIGLATEAFPVLDNFKIVLGDNNVIETITRTLAFVIIGTPIELIIGLFFAFILKNTLPMYKIVRTLSIIPFAMPTIVTAVILFVLFDFPNGHVNAFLMGKYSIFPIQVIDYPIAWRSNQFFALLLAMIGKVWRDTPITTFILLGGILQISKEEIDTARSLGASKWHTFRYIIIPQIMPYIVVVLILRSIEFWKEFIFAFVLSGRYTLLATLVEEYYHTWHNLGVASVISLIILGFILVTVFLIKIIAKLIERYTTTLIKKEK